MNDSPRFKSAVASVRPHDVWVIEAYRPKLGRRLQCFGELAFVQWICLEADPMVQTFCERPVTLDLGEGKQLADCWARSDNGETLLLVDDECQASPVVIGGMEWSVRVIPLAGLAGAHGDHPIAVEFLLVLVSGAGRVGKRQFATDWPTNLLSGQGMPTTLRAKLAKPLNF